MLVGVVQLGSGVRVKSVGRDRQCVGPWRV